MTTRRQIETLVRGADEFIKKATAEQRAALVQSVISVHAEEIALARGENAEVIKFLLLLNMLASCIASVHEVDRLTLTQMVSRELPLRVRAMRAALDSWEEK